MQGDIYLGRIGSEVLLPSDGRKVQESDIEIIKESRTIDGTLVSDLIAVKKQFTITFDPGLDDPTLQTILDIYDIRENLNMIITNRDGSTRNYTVILRPISRTREEAFDLWWYTGITMVLEEV